MLDQIASGKGLPGREPSQYRSLAASAETGSKPKRIGFALPALTATLTATAPDFGTPAQPVMRPLRRTRTSTDFLPAPFDPRVVGRTPRTPASLLHTPAATGRSPRAQFPYFGKGHMSTDTPARARPGISFASGWVVHPPRADRSTWRLRRRRLVDIQCGVALHRTNGEDHELCVALCDHGALAVMLLTTGFVTSASAAKPTRTVMHPESFVVPAGQGCSFAVAEEINEDARVTVTEFADGRVVIHGRADPRLINVDSGASLVQHTSAKITETDGGLVREVSGQLFMSFWPGDEGPHGLTEYPGGLFSVNGHVRLTLDPSTFLYTSFTLNGTATDLCAALEAE